ncbi:AraC family transcriptional regulator [Aquiflexum sp. XJ19-11]|uniref:AraC family transcriptional regulator n=2 Tax=Aquiflexum gelatinilyticum TaxID=2961943 RepID=A0A9X2P3B9_9BACT|nr:AraC family transcriptional regulator [Aquiflexum gelatinilyticum]MCR9013816.1 AraC family transcriptional regulator [Aquiflexum gelatinilyticum]
MVSYRCIMVVKEELKNLDIRYSNVNLGEVEVSQKITASQKEALRLNLKKIGLELLDDKKSILIDKIKNEVIKMIHQSEAPPTINYSEHISEQLGYDYTYLSNVFSEVQGITIQQFIIFNKIEKVKELLLYNELNLTEISYQLDYSSVAHLSNQFKKVTGLTPSYFKRMKEMRKKIL